ncbi:F-box protein [Salix suchowensis]|nr:F-box protein [Salix suchowensis]
MGQSSSSCSSSNGHEIYRPIIIGKNSSVVDGDDDLTLSLPDECLGSVFGKLGCHDRNSCSLVCKRWRCVDSKSRNRLVLLARSEMSPCLPSLLSRFNTVSILSLKCSRKLLSIDDDALSRIPIFLPFLKKLKLKGCVHISDDGLHAFSLHRPPFLAKLSFASCGFGAKGLTSLLSNCPSLQDLTLKRLRKLDATSSTPASSFWVGALNAGGDDGGNDHHNNIGAIVAGAAKREKDVHGYCYKSLRLERLCLKDLHNARLFIPLILSASASIKTLIVCRSSGNWDRVLETSLHGKTTSISEIQMDNVQMGDAGLLAISSSCPDLQLLYLSRTTDCTDDGLSAVANSCKKLRKLHVDAWSRFGSRTIGDEGVFSIANKCSQLQELVLMGIPVAIRSLNALASNCPGLERMALCNTDSVQDSEMAFIASKFLALKKLCIKNCPNVSKSGIEAVGRGCPNLVKLKVKRCKGVTQAMVSRLRFQRSSLVVSVDAGSILFDSEGISLLASSVNEDEQGTATAMTNPNSARSAAAAASTVAATHVICSSRGALLLRSKFESALQLGRRRRPIEDNAS